MLVLSTAALVAVVALCYAVLGARGPGPEGSTRPAASRVA
jgi:hypothetical protein